MLAKQNDQNSITVSFIKISWILILLLWALVSGVQAQTAAKKTNLPFLQDYKGVKIGMTAAEVREKLGKPASEDKEGLLYVFDNDTETTQIIIDAEQKVRTVSVMFTGDNLKPLMFEQVFGKTVQPEAQPNGAITKLVKYADAGCWVSYNRMAGDKPTIMVVMQKF
jgi:outer membrane protein assembly factor BamE (lipoprotein component of BamABCDE complex)